MTWQDSDIDRLALLTKEQVEELKKEKIYTSLQLLLAPSHLLEKHFGKEELATVLSMLQSQVNGFYRILGAHDIVRVSTGSKSLDAKLGGGITSGQITEICSEQRYPRTLFCYSVLLRFLREHEDARVLYNDPATKFRPEKLCELGSHYYLSQREILDRILVFRPYNIIQQMEIFEIYDSNLKASRNKLIMVDGLGDFFKFAAEKKNIIYHKIRAMENFMLRLNHLAAREGTIVLLSNSTIERFKDKTIVPESDKIIGESIKTNILLHRREDATWEAKVMSSGESCSVQLSLSEYGFGDTI